MTIDPTNAVIVENMNRTIPEAATMVALAGRQVARYASVAEEFAPLAAYTNMLFFVAQVDLDTRVLLRNLVADPNARITSEKYLALALIEAERGAGTLFNRLRGAANMQHGKLAGFIDIPSLQVAKDAFDSKLLPMREDKGFNQELTLIRNEVVAHFVSKESGVENSAAWAVTRDSLPKGEDAILNSKIVEYSIALSHGLRALSEGITASIRDWQSRNPA